MRRALALVSALACIALATTAAAQPEASDATERARAHFEEGQRLARHGQLEEAHGEFTRGYQLSGRAAFLFNMAECLRQLGRLDEARARYEQYLATEPSEEMSARVRRRLDEMAARTPESEVMLPGPALEIPAPEPAVHLEPTDDTPEPPRGPSLVDEWWFWLCIGLAVAAVGVAIAVPLGLDANAPRPCEAPCVVLDFDP